MLPASVSLCKQKSKSGTKQLCFNNILGNTVFGERIKQDDFDSKKQITKQAG